MQNSKGSAKLAVIHNYVDLLSYFNNDRNTETFVHLVNVQGMYEDNTIYALNKLQEGRRQI